MAPTKKQQQVFEALLFLIEKGERPTVREIGALVGLRSPATVMKHLQALEREGLVSMSGKSRGIVATMAERRRGSEAPRGIPVLGRIAAGTPIAAVEQATGAIAIDPSLFAGSGELLSLRVAGDSMIEAGILDGDYVIIRRQSIVEDGEIAAVEIDGEVTLKRWRGGASDADPEDRSSLEAGEASGPSIRLIPANARIQPIEIAASDHKEVRVLGKYVGLVRGEIRLGS